MKAKKSKRVNYYVSMVRRSSGIVRFGVEVDKNSNEPTADFDVLRPHTRAILDQEFVLVLTSSGIKESKDSRFPWESKISNICKIMLTEEAARSIMSTRPTREE